MEDGGYDGADDDSEGGTGKTKNPTDQEQEAGRNTTENVDNSNTLRIAFIKGIL